MTRLIAPLALLLAVPVGYGQLLPAPSDLEPESAPVSEPLIFRDAASQPTAPASSADEAAQRLYRMMREIAQSDLSYAQQQQRMHALMDQHPTVYPGPRGERPETPEQAVAELERMFFQAVLEVAPDAAARSTVIKNLPADVRIEPNRPFLMARDPNTRLVRPADPGVAESERPWWGGARVDLDPAALEQKQSPGKATAAAKPVLKKVGPDEPQDSTEAVAEVPKVAVLTDEAATVEMHDDTTVLKNVTDDDGALVLFDSIHIWAGGAVQYEFYTGEDLFTARDGGDSTDDHYVRRGEVIGRVSYREFGELKLQYDLDSNIWRDLYWRTVDQKQGRRITVGNQDEPMGMDNMLGNKFTLANEISAPATAFGAFKGIGVQLSDWFERDAEDALLKLDGGGTAFNTFSVGVFTQDIENSSDTDFATTARLTTGRQGASGRGVHLGVSGTLRKGQFDRIAPRPGIYDTDRITLARPDAEYMGVVGLEAMALQGSAMAQAEAYYGDYRGGDVDARGVGGYVQAGWLFGDQTYSYRPEFGLLAPVNAGGKSVFEAFIRASYTRGNDDINAANALAMLTVGGSWYLHRFRNSINVIYTDVDRDVNGEDSGLAAVLRVQYLF